MTSGNGVQASDVLIIGGGPAGLTAAIYARRAALHTVILERGAIGGQLLETDMVENFPGFPEPISGQELMDRMRAQAQRLDTEMRLAEATTLESQGDLWRVTSTNGTFMARCVILATGAHPKELDVLGAQELKGKGLSYCATCDGYFYRDKPVLMVGAGDAGITEALFMTRIAREVFVVVRHPEADPKAIRATPILRERALKHPKIRFLWNQVVDAFRGDGRLESVVLRDLSDGRRVELKVDGAFVKIGYAPATSWLHGVVELSDDGYIRTDAWMRTSRPGVFAAGDVREPHGRCAQAVVAAAEGAISAMQAAEYVSEGGG